MRRFVTTAVGVVVMVISLGVVLDAVPPPVTAAGDASAAMPHMASAGRTCRQERLLPARGVATDGTCVYVADTDNGRIVKRGAQ